MKITLVYSADGAKLIAVYNNGKLAKQSSMGITEGELLALFGFHGKAVLNPEFDSDDIEVPLTLPNYSTFQNYTF